MARAFTVEQKALLRSERIRAHGLFTFFLDEGTYRFCDDVVDMSDGVNTFIGAQAVLDAVEIRAGRDLAAEQVTMKCDANRMAQAGINDPAKVLRDMLGYLTQQRRVDIALGFSAMDSTTIALIIPVYAGKINYARLVDDNFDPSSQEEAVGTLEIVLDSLAARYGKPQTRTRSHEDQKSLFPDDDFFSFVTAASISETNLYWGKKGGGDAGGISGLIGGVLGGLFNQGAFRG